jgi:hypothetical protein
VRSPWGTCHQQRWIGVVGYSCWARLVRSVSPSSTTSAGAGSPISCAGHRRPVLADGQPEQVAVRPASPRRPGAAGQPQRQSYPHPVFVRPGAGAGAIEHHHVRGRVPRPQRAVDAGQCGGIGQRVVRLPRCGGSTGQLSGQPRGPGRVIPTMVRHEALLVRMEVGVLRRRAVVAVG